MRRIVNMTVLIAFFTGLAGQTPVGTWSDHLIYNKAENLAIGSKEVYASTG
ncbi:MAG: hypothetical protein H6Q23_1927, partial [Bacteroidetes bacterium]|nr:hypothetical protein [Bacteroidota bacterium]